MMRQMEKSVIGQEEVVRTLTLALLCNGNVLLEGLPGTAKTRSIKTLSSVNLGNSTRAATSTMTSTTRICTRMISDFLNGTFMN